MSIAYPTIHKPTANLYHLHYRNPRPYQKSIQNNSTSTHPKTNICQTNPSHLAPTSIPCMPTSKIKQQICTTATQTCIPIAQSASTSNTSEPQPQTNFLLPHHTLPFTAPATKLRAHVSAAHHRATDFGRPRLTTRHVTGVEGDRVA